MILHEYQAKQRFAEFGIPIPAGRTATTSQEAYETARDIGDSVVVKAQVHIHNRWEMGGIKLARTPEQAERYAHDMLGSIVGGTIVRKVLVDPALNVHSEIYLGVTYDRSSGQPVVIASAEGGVELKRVAREQPDAVVREYVNPFLGLLDYQARNLANGINLPHQYWRGFTKIAKSLFQCYAVNDATLAEINPLVITREHRLVALNGKMVIDDNALYRQSRLAEMRDIEAEPFEETQARAAGVSYVKLDGQIGCMVNGAGLAMATMDMIWQYGGQEVAPANFLDIGGGAQSDKVAAALRIILLDTKVKAVLLNIFGGLTRCDEVARGILRVLNEVEVELPMVVRLAGTNADAGRRLIDDAHLPHLFSAVSLAEAARKVVEAARKG